MTRADLIVIGAGPAGAAAAIEASEHGLDVILLDEAPAAGGQGFKALPTAFVPEHQRSCEAVRKGEALRAGVA
ncbi:MAG: FAD-dependent oxidoreductase, partial [Acidobacteria bacterium]|nr:FAD-dependent oxidoreductase [Acidobacteriota bacterium]